MTSLSKQYPQLHPKSKNT